MSNSPNNRDRQSGGDGFFPRTRWSIILEAKGEGEEAEGAFAELMKLYRKPIYASFYHHCKNEEDAKDLTQSFILGLLRRDDIKKIDPEKGRFRSFLRAAIKHFKANDYDFRTAASRWSGSPDLSLDAGLDESLLAAPSGDNEDPSLAFDRRWFRTILEDCAVELRQEWTAAGKAEEFELLEDFLIPQERNLPYKEVAMKIQKEVGTIRVAAYRLRKRYRALIRDRIQATVCDAKEVALELEYLSGLIGFEPYVD